MGAKALTEEDIDDMVDAFYRCTMCRRCGVNCPLAVDNALITRVGPGHPGESRFCAQEYDRERPGAAR